MNHLRSLNFFILILLLIAVIFFGWKYTTLHQEVEDLQNQVASESQVANQNNLIDPPNGETETSDWSLIENELYGFSLIYPQTWIVDPSDENIVIPQGFISDQSDLKNEAPLTLTVSTNTEISNSWRKITLTSGESAYYNFEEIFDHYYMINRNNMLIWTIPARSHDGLYTDQQLKEAIQIVNTYQPLEVF